MTISASSDQSLHPVTTRHWAEPYVARNQDIALRYTRHPWHQQFERSPEALWPAMLCVQRPACDEDEPR